MHSNSGFEGKDGANARNDALEKLEEHFKTAVDEIYEEVEEETIDKSNPFFAHAYDGLPPLDNEVAGE